MNSQKKQEQQVKEQRKHRGQERDFYISPGAQRLWHTEQEQGKNLEQKQEWCQQGWAGGTFLKTACLHT